MEFHSVHSHATLRSWASSIATRVLSWLTERKQATMSSNEATKHNLKIA